MNMKKSLMVSLMTLVSMPVVASASDGTITFNGEIKSGTCVVSDDSGAAAPNRVVPMPTVSTLALNGVGKTAGATQFDIFLSQCGPNVTPKIYFDSAAYVPGDSSLLRNMAQTGGAGNVAVALSDRTTATPVSAVGGVVQQGPGSTDALKRYPMIAEYRSLGETVSAGNVSAQAMFSIQYD